MNFRQMVKKILPPIAVDTARWLLDKYQLTTPASGYVRIYYELVPAWTRAKEGTGTFDFEVAKRSPESELDVPVVRDNLEALALIDLPEAKLLDFGSGNGHYYRILSANPRTGKWRYVGVDKMPEEIEFCRRNYPGIDFETVEEGKPLPFTDNAFDVVLASGTLQYIRDTVATLAELRRITREYVLVSRLPTWKYHDSQIVVQHLKGSFGEEEYPLHVFNRKAIEDVFAQVGFEVIYPDWGSEYFSVPGVREPAAHTLYLLGKVEGKSLSPTDFVVGEESVQTIG